MKAKIYKKNSPEFDALLYEEDNREYYVKWYYPETKHFSGGRCKHSKGSALEAIWRWMKTIDKINDTPCVYCMVPVE